jgi:uncharacterized membrane protein YiaA
MVKLSTPLQRNTYNQIFIVKFHWAMTIKGTSGNLMNTLLLVQEVNVYLLFLFPSSMFLGGKGYQG